MNKKINFTKVKTYSKETTSSSSQQTTISKFFTVKNKNQDLFDALQNNIQPQLTKPQNSSSITQIEDEKQKSQPNHRVINKLTSFSFDPNQHENEKTELKIDSNPTIEDDPMEELPEKTVKQTKNSKNEFTPLENQFLNIKKHHQDAILFVECGYKYRFFGEDAEIAAKELNICCTTKYNLSSASIPSYRLFLHVRRLVAKGYKVGVIKQTESAGLKSASENKYTPFDRKISAFYTKATLIGEDVDLKYDREQDEYSEAPFLFCMCEDGPRIGILAVRATTGEIIFDQFVDDSAKKGLDDRLTRINPCEIIIPDKQITSSTLGVINQYKSINNNEIRIETFPIDDFDHITALCSVTKFYTESSSDNLHKILDLPPNVIRCLSVIIKHLTKFHLEKILTLATNENFMTKFDSQTGFLNLNSTTIRNLEIFANLTNGTKNGSLFWAMNFTSTAFGERLLRDWISHPLQNIREIETRQDITTELAISKSCVVSDLKGLLTKMADLEKQLASVHHLNCSTSTFYSLIKTFSSVESTLNSLKSKIEFEIENSTLKLFLQQLHQSFNINCSLFLQNLNEKAALSGDKTKLFLDISFFPALVSCHDKMKITLDKLKDLRGSICKILKFPGFNYTTVAGQEFLIEVKNSYLGVVPADWTKINVTKAVSRFRSPEVEKLHQEVICLREELALVSQEAWLFYLKDFNQHFFKFSSAIKNLAILDCYLSLAQLAKNPDYCRPLFVEHSNVIHIEKGRHPVLPLILPEGKQFVDNDTRLDEDTKCMLISGPNMGGKSCYLRQVALIVLMAHVGSYVPAKDTVLSVVDGIYTRMGASDDLFKNRSTFLVELEEASQALSSATSKSLIVFDELGRGTSTHDGSAIAHATLEYLLNQVKCFVLFVTHYTSVITEFKTTPFRNVGCFHVGFLTEDELTGEEVTFLYELKEGVCEESFGLNVAKMAGLQSDILKIAVNNSRKMKNEVERRKNLRQDFCLKWRGL